MEEPGSDKTQPIAVIGIGCRFPGEATSPEALWDMLLRGESAWSEFPEDRVNISSYYHPSGSRQGTICFRGAHFLKQNIAAFDSSFFGIPADEAKAVDPQQRILLEVTVEALDSAGVDRNAIRKSETGVWIGSFVKDYEQIVLRDYDDQPQYGATGNGTAIMSNRLSYFLDIGGPSMTIDTGCSASLVCVHLACQSLLTGETDMALAGGAGLILTPNTMMPMTALNFLSPDGRSYTFDARANGYGRGEGVGIVVLKRLSDAVRDNDNIRAIIRNTRLNQDGRTPGITLPSTEAQIRNMRGVYERAGLDPSRTAYVECHGTGTQAGDVRELKALSESIAKDRSIDNPLFVGSIKTNVGHLEGSAGIAGLIKGILTVEKGTIPKHINFKAPGNPAIDFEAWKVKVPIENTAWPMEGPRRVSVNSFGFGGTNAHAVLDDAAHYLAERGIRASHSTTLLTHLKDPSVHHTGLVATIAAVKGWRKLIAANAEGLIIPPQDFRSHVFLFSAHDQDSLLRMTKGYAHYLSEHSRDISNEHGHMDDLAYTLNCRRTKLQWRVAISAASVDELTTKLQAVVKTDVIRTSEDKILNVAFVFSGQGAQWHAMGRELLGYDVYLESIAAASKYMTDTLGSSFSLVAEILKDKACSRINEPQISQPATTALQVALVDFLVHHCGIIPSSVVGHSSGEIAAAYASGIISRETAWSLAYYRGVCADSLLELADGEHQSRGGMLSVGLGEHEANTYVKKIGSDRITVACINSPASVTLSGDYDAILEAQEILTSDNIFNRLLVVDIAYHSHHMARCAAEYSSSIGHLKPREPTRPLKTHPNSEGKMLGISDLGLDSAVAQTRSDAQLTKMYSSVTGSQVDWYHVTSLYWVANLVSIVRFSEAIDAMLHPSDGKKPDYIVEIGPSSALKTPLQQIFENDPVLIQNPKCISILRRGVDATTTTLQAIGELWTRGCNIAMPWVVMRNAQLRRPKTLPNLPNYPWNHEAQHWYESHLSKANRLAPHGRYDLIGRPTPDSVPFQPRWRGFFRLSENPWIEHHKVQKTIIYPAAGMVTMVLEGAKQLAPDSTVAIELSNFRIDRAMMIPSSDHGLEYALNMTSKDCTTSHESNTSGSTQDSISTPISYEFFIYSKLLNAAWQQHGSGIVTIHVSQVAGDAADSQGAGKNTLQADRYYEKYLAAASACDEAVIPRQLYETLDVIGMNYGTLFQNITSLHKRDSNCTFVVQIPDTLSIMPAQFEYPHILHPATLDSVFQTAFCFGNDSMVPSYIGSIYISMVPQLPKGAGQEFVGYATAERQGLREANVSFVMSDNTWKKTEFEAVQNPLVIIKDMKFTALSTNTGLGSNSFIPSHHNLCSQILWEPVLHVETKGSTEQHLDEIAGQTFLLVPENMGLSLRRVCSLLCERLKCSSFTLAQIKEDREYPGYCLSLLEILPEDHFIWNWSNTDYADFRLLVSSTRGLLWLTNGAQMNSNNPKSSLFQALARTIHSESPQKHLVTFDIDTNTDIEATDSIEMIATLFLSTFTEGIHDEPRETEFTERNGQLLVPRLVPVSSINTMIEHGTTSAEPPLSLLSDHQSRKLKLGFGEIGNLESLSWDTDEVPHEALPSGDVVIKVLAAGLGSLDADMASGDSQYGDLGIDAYGVIEVIGNEVRGLAVGDFVIVVARGTLREQIRCHRSMVQKVPEGSDPSIVLLPTAITIASYALYALASLESCQSILVHVGEGFLGKAAIKLAQHTGATVFATYTNDEQRKILRHDYQLPEERVFDSNNDLFVEAIMGATQYTGVDVIFDTTAEYRFGNSHCIANLGQIMNISKKYMAKSQVVDSTSKTFTVQTIDSRVLIQKEPWRLAESRRILGSINTSEWLTQCCSIVKKYDWMNLSNAISASTGDNQCDMAYCVRSEATNIPIMPCRDESAKEHLRSDGTYVLAGQGGLAVHIARVLEANGVKSIAFLSRSGTTSEASKTTVAFLQHRGVTVRVFKVDICDKGALSDVVADIRASMPPIRGLFQCAATLRDAIFDTMSYEYWQAAINPKTIGSWNLFESFPQNMDFFIFLSSSVGIIGNRGQANYATGNAFQDALARHINFKGGMRAVSIDLGPVLGAGMLADDPGTLDKLKATGFFGVRLKDFVCVVERAIAGFTKGRESIPPQVVMGVGTGGLMRQNKPADPYWTRTALFAHLNKVDMPENQDHLDSDTDVSKQTTKTLLSSAKTVDEACRIVNIGLCTVLAVSMGKQAEDIDEGRPPTAYGVDSLVAVNVRNWVYRECGVDLSIFEILSDTSITELSETISERGKFGTAK